MNARMQRFADEWLSGANTGKRFHIPSAAEYAGYSVDNMNPSATGSKLLRHPEVKEYIKKRLEAHAMSAAEVMARFTDIARNTAAGDVLFRDAHGNLRIDNDKVLKNKEYIKSFTFDSNGHEKVEFYDALDALKQVARVLSMFTDGLELSGPGGGAVPVAMQVQFVSPGGETVNPTGTTPENNDADEDFSDLENL